MRFDEKFYFSNLLGSTPYWDYKPTNAIRADSPVVYTSDNFIILGTKEKIHLKCDVIYGSFVHEIQEPILFNFTVDKPPGYNVFCAPEAIQYENINKSVSRTITFL